MLKILPMLAAANIVLLLIADQLSSIAGVPFNARYAFSFSGLILGLAVFTGAFRVEAGLSIGMISGIGVAIWAGTGKNPVACATAGMAIGYTATVCIAVVLVAEIGVASTIEIGIVLAAMTGLGVGLVSSRLQGDVVTTSAFSIGFLFGYFRLITYPLECVVSLFSYLLSLENPPMTKIAWRSCPAAWNELVWLPVPFAPGLLARFTIKYRVRGLAEIRRLARHRRLQRRLALNAVSELLLIDMHAVTLWELSELPLKLRWVDNPPAELVGEVSKNFPRMDRVARYAAQSSEVTNVQRKYDALDSAIKETRVLQEKLRPVHGRFGRRLRRGIVEWRSILEEEIRFVQHLAREQREILNPFVFGNAVRETETNIFVGRKDIGKLIEANLLNMGQTPTLLLLGARRMGKTSILLQLPRLLGPDWIPVIIDCQSPAVKATEGDFFQYVSRAIRETLNKRGLGVRTMEASSFKSPTVASFDDWLRRLQLAIPENNRLLVCLDEYEDLDHAFEKGWGNNILDELRHILQHHPRFVLMFAGAHRFQEMRSAWLERFINARTIRVSFLAKEDVRLLLTQPVPDFDMTYAPGSLDRIISVANGQPFLTQAIASELVDCMNDRRSKVATLNAVEEAITRAIDQSQGYFKNVWEHAQDEGHFAMVDALKKKDVTKYPGFEWLLQNDVLTDDGRFAVPMMEMWVERFIKQSNFSSRGDQTNS